MGCLSPGRSVALLLCTLAAACASVDRTTTNGSEPEPSPASDGGSGDAASEPATGDGVILFSPADDRSDVVYVAAAFRSKVPPNDLPPLDDDPCHLFEAEGEPSVYVGDVTAGKVTVRAGSHEVSLKLRGEGHKAYDASPPLEGILPGAPIEVEATGGTVPAFRVSLELAHPVEVLTPLADGIAKDAAFDIAWKPPPRDQLLAIQLVGKNRRLFCKTDTASGAFVIPEEHVRAMAADPSSTDDGKPALELRFGTSIQSAVRAGAYDIRAQSARHSHAMLVLR